MSWSQQADDPECYCGDDDVPQQSFGNGSPRRGSYSPQMDRSSQMGSRSPPPRALTAGGFGMGRRYGAMENLNQISQVGSPSPRRYSSSPRSPASPRSSPSSRAPPSPRSPPNLRSPSNQNYRSGYASGAQSRNMSYQNASMRAGSGRRPSASTGNYGGNESSMLVPCQSQYSPDRSLSITRQTGVSSFGTPDRRLLQGDPEPWGQTSMPAVRTQGIPFVPGRIGQSYNPYLENTYELRENFLPEAQSTPQTIECPAASQSYASNNDWIEPAEEYMPQSIVCPSAQQEDLSEERPHKQTTLQTIKTTVSNSSFGSWTEVITASMDASGSVDEDYMRKVFAGEIQKAITPSDPNRAVAESGQDYTYLLQATLSKNRIEQDEESYYEEDDNDVDDCQC